MNPRINRRQGFTLIELIVIIAIIAILATISVIGFGRFQADTRDARRVSSVSAIAEALEKYYDQNGEYPSCAAMKNDPQSTLKNVESRTFVVPGANSSTANSFKCSSDGNTLTINGADFYEYQGDGSAECNASTSCVQFTIRYKDESDGQIKTITSRRQTQIASQGSIVMASNSVSFTSFNLTWTAISNAVSYTLQESSDADFNNNLVETTQTAPNVSIAGKTAGTTYFYRVKASGGTDQTTDWSRTLSVKTLALETPTITAIAAANTSLTPTWTAAANATSYRVQYSTTSSFSSPTTITTAATSYSTPPTLDQGRIYYFRVYALNGTNTGSPSVTNSTNTTIATPSAPNMATPANTDNTTSYSTVFAWSAASTCPANTTMQYQYQYQYNSTAGYTSTMSSATSITSLTISTTEGYTYNVYTYARCRSNSTTSIASSWSGASTRSYYQNVSTPTNIAWSASRANSTKVNLTVTATCRGGTFYYGLFDEYLAGNMVWTEGPNVGNSGWYTPGGWRVVNVYYPSGGVQNIQGDMPNGAYFTAKAYIVCKNNVTDAQGPGVNTQGPGWTWGSNV